MIGSFIIKQILIVIPNSKVRQKVKVNSIVQKVNKIDHSKLHFFDATHSLSLLKFHGYRHLKPIFQFGFQGMLNCSKVDFICLLNDNQSCETHNHVEFVINEK